MASPSDLGLADEASTEGIITLVYTPHPFKEQDAKKNGWWDSLDGCDSVSHQRKGFHRRLLSASARWRYKAYAHRIVAGIVNEYITVSLYSGIAYATPQAISARPFYSSPVIAVPHRSSLACPRS
jgi:hypothetical protein